MELMEAKPQDKLSKQSVIDEAEKYDGTNGSIAFAKGVRYAIKLVLPYIQDYWIGKFEKLIK